MSSVKLNTEIGESEYFYYSLKKVAINYYTDTISKYNAGQLIKCFSQIRPTCFYLVHQEAPINGKNVFFISGKRCTGWKRSVVSIFAL